MEVYIAALAVGIVVIWGMRFIANWIDNTVQKLTRTSFESPSIATEFETPYLESRILVERAAVGLIAASLIAARMSDPQYHELLSTLRKTQSDLDLKKMDVVLGPDEPGKGRVRLEDIESSIKWAERREQQEDLFRWEGRRKMVDMAWEIWRDVKLKQEEHYKRGSSRRVGHPDKGD